MSPVDQQLHISIDQIGLAAENVPLLEMPFVLFSAKIKNT